MIEGKINLPELLQFLGYKKPSECSFFNDCIIDDTGIRAKPIDEQTENTLIGDEWLVFKDFEKDIQIDLPCSFETLKGWAERNSFELKVSEKASQNLKKFTEYLFNGKDIDWSYWESLSNITTEQAAKLIHHIDPNLWTDDKFAAGQLYSESVKGEKILNLTLAEIRNLKQRLDNQSSKWSLVDVVNFLGVENVPLGMAEAVEQQVCNKTNLTGELQQAIAEIKASRTPGSITVDELLESPVSQLLEEIEETSGYGKYFQLYGWKKLCKNEKERVKNANYADEARREDRLKLLKTKIKEIESHLEGKEPQTGDIETPKTKAEIESATIRDSVVNQAVIPQIEKKITVNTELTNVNDGTTRQSKIELVTRNQIKIIFNKRTETEWRGDFGREKDNGLHSAREGEPRKPKYTLEKVGNWLTEKAYYIPAEIKDAIRKYYEPQNENSKQNPNKNIKTNLGNSPYAPETKNQ